MNRIIDGYRIIVERRSRDFIAKLADYPKIWECGGCETDATDRLTISMRAASFASRIADYK